MMSFFRAFAATLVLFALSSCTEAKSSVEARKEKIEAMATDVTPASLDRRARSNVRLEAEGVPVLASLPVIEDAADVVPRSREEIAWRAMALLVVAVKGEGLEQPVIEQLVAEYGLQPHFTPAERAFIADPAPSEHARVQFAWRYEAAWTLLWALGYVEELGKPTGICDVPRAVRFLQERGPQRFIADAKPRPIDAILDEADLIYRYHWAVVDARVNGRPAPASLEPGVTQERHYALNWLVGYMDQDWDDISTDT